MQDTKSLKLLKALNKEEFRRLGKFLRSPFYNYSKPLIALYDHLKKYYPDFASKKLEKEKVWAKLFPAKPFNDNGYWNLCFQFLKIVEKFLVALQLEAQPNEEKKLYIRALGGRNIYDLFEKETKTLVGKIDGQSHQDIHSYSESLWLKHDYFFNPLTDKYGGAIFSVEDAMEDLDRFFSLAKLRFASEIKNRERIFSKKVPVQLLEESISASKKYEEENPAFLMYKIVLDLYVPEKAEAAFQKGKELMENKFPLMSRHDQNEVMLNFRNYAIRELNKGQTEYWREIFELYKLGLELNLIIDEGKLSDAAFGNIVKVGCINKEFDWTINFIDTYDLYLPEEVRKDAKILSLGIVLYHRNEFEKAIEILGQHDFSQILHQMNAKTLLVKSWFDIFLDNNSFYELLYSNLMAVEKSFRRIGSISDLKKAEHVNFILVIRKISESVLRKKINKEEKAKFYNYLENKKNIMSRDWLKEKINNL